MGREEGGRLGGGEGKEVGGGGREGEEGGRWRREE